jgi:hypothetical protein
MTIQEELIKRFHAAFDTMLHKAAEKGSAVVRVPISDLGILIGQADLACASIDGFVTRLVGAANGHAVEIELAKRFLDSMRDVVAKATERKPLAVKIPAADLYLLLQFAKAGPIDYSRVRFLGPIVASVEVVIGGDVPDPDRVFANFVPQIGVDLAGGSDRTVVTKVEIVDGAPILDHEIEDLGAVARSTK